MPVLDRTVQPLRAGETLSREEFLSRWEALPSLKRAELIEGRVYLPSPVGTLHRRIHLIVASWLGTYAFSTPGCSGGMEGTWLMLNDAPQPDVSLEVLPEYGGQSGTGGPLSAGAPELIAEVAHSSAARDLGPKLRLYRAAGVREYITVLINESEVVWRFLERGDYTVIEPGEDGILRSELFPGLWLDPAALWAYDGQRVLQALQGGLKTPEHARFVRDLAAKAERLR